MTTLEGRKRFNAINCGRRWGKTVLGADVAMEMMTAGYPVGWFAPEYKYLLGAWDAFDKALQSITTRRNQNERLIEVKGGGSLEMWSLDGGNAGRSRKYARVIVDEAALVPNLMKRWTEDIRATLTDLKGDAWFLSTPKGRNDFYQLWLRGQDPLDTEWQSWQMPTLSNPFIDPAELEDARKDLPERVFLQEYMAEFLEDSEVFRKITEAAVGRYQRYSNDEFDPEPHHQYVVGVDWGKQKDFSVFSVIDTTINELCYLDRSNKLDYLVQLDRLSQVFRKFNVTQIIAEGNSQATTMELLRSTGLPVREFTTTKESKPYIIENLMLAFERADLKIIPDPVLLGELRSFEATRLPSGYIRYAAPAGYHDDCVMSLALAWDGCKETNMAVTIHGKGKNWKKRR